MQSTDGFPDSGNSLFALHVDNAPPGARAVLALALNSIPPVLLAGTPDCFLYNQYFVALTVPGTVGGNGQATIPLPIPLGVTGQFRTQFAIADPASNALGITVSNGGEATIGSSPPIKITGMSGGPLNLGSTLTVTGSGFGNNPTGLCFRTIDANGNTVLLVGNTITSSSGVDTVQMTVMHAPQVAVNAPLMAFRGGGGSPAIMGLNGVGAPTDSFVWQGENAPANMVTGLTNILVGLQTPCPGQTAVYGTLKPIRLGNSDCLELTIPPCPTGLSYKSLTYDVHWDWVFCNVNGVARHYDGFVGSCAISNPPGGATRIAFAMAFQLTGAFFAQFGTALSISTGPNPGTVYICPPPGVDCSPLNGPWGTILLCCG